MQKNMKYTVFGVSSRMCRHWAGWDNPRNHHREDWDSFLKQAREDYIKTRANGTDIDNPAKGIPFDGRYSWVPCQVRNHSIRRYTEGHGDRAWIEERDWNYIQRLLREGRLLESEPHADSEIASNHKFRIEIIRALETARAERRRREVEQERQALIKEKHSRLPECERAIIDAKEKIAELRREEDSLLHSILENQTTMQSHKNEYEIKNKFLQEEIDRLYQLIKITQAKASELDRIITELHKEREGIALELEVDKSFYETIFLIIQKLGLEEGHLAASHDSEAIESIARGHDILGQVDDRTKSVGSVHHRIYFFESLARTHGGENIEERHDALPR